MKDQKLSRLLGNNPILDKKKFFQYIELFKQVKISLTYCKSDDQQDDQYVSWRRAQTLINLLSRDNSICIPDPESFFNYLEKNLLEIEDKVLSILYYNCLYDNGEFVEMTFEQKINKLIENADTEYLNAFKRYQKDRNLFRLIEQCHGDWKFEE